MGRGSGRVGAKKAGAFGVETLAALACGCSAVSLGNETSSSLETYHELAILVSILYYNKTDKVQLMLCK
jgi:hypothetical protein